MSHSTSTPRHPLLACADTIEKALAAVLDCDPAYLDADDKAELLLRLTRLLSQQEALRLRTVAAAGDLAADHGCRTVADWLAPRTRTDRRAAYAQEKLAHALDNTWRQVGAALADGRLHLDQARVIVKALDALPDDVGVEVKQLAERRLVEHAEQFGPADLARLGRRVLDVVAPEVGDDQERRALERAERKAEAVTRLDFRRRGDGSTDIAATVPDAIAARLKTYLEAFTSPRATPAGATATRDDPATGVRLPADRQRGLAFCALLERLDPTRLPDHGGLATTMIVTIPLETLQTGLGTAQLGTGEPITAGEARRLACTAGLVPAVLGTTSPRSSTSAAPPGCSPPPNARPSPCATPAAGPRTVTSPHPGARPTTPPPGPRAARPNLTDGVLLCHWHHQRAHDTRYTTTRTPNGDLRYHRRT